MLEHEILRIKIFHILWSGRAGGAERFVKDIVQYSDKAKFQHVVCFLSQGGRLAEEMVSSGAEIHVLGMQGGWSFLGASRLYNLLRSSCPHIIHNHARNYLANIVLLLFKDIPKIYFEHGGSLLSGEDGRDILFYRLFGNKHDLVLANSDYVRRKILERTRLAPEKIKVFYIGIDTTAYQFPHDEAFKVSMSVPEGSQVVGVVGRLVEMKGLDSFIRIAADLNKYGNSVRRSFFIVGEGPLRASLEVLARDLQVDVHFLGDRQDVPKILSAMDVFLFTSKWEPFGIVVLEAMAAGVPVVGFGGSGASEIMRHGGAVVIENRDIEKAAAAVHDILSDKANARKLGEGGRANVRAHFEIRRSIEELENIYASLTTDRYEIS